MRSRIGAFKFILVGALTGSMLFGAAEAYGSAELSAEPAWCNPAGFGKYVVEAIPDQGIFVFKVGRLTLAGMPIGEMETNEPQMIARSFSRSNDREGYCTWYVNSGNAAAEAAYVHLHLPAPASIVSNGLRDEYLRRLDSTFGAGPNSFLHCAEKRKYVAIGCNQMHHRGPTAFAMLLAFSGCSADHATQIVNRYWGLNFIPYWVRAGIVQGAADLGQSRPTLRARLQRVMH